MCRTYHRAPVQEGLPDAALVESYFSTGELRAVNSDATWSSASPYVSLNTISTFTNPGAFRRDSIIQIALNRSATYSSTATATVTHGSFRTSFTLTNIPAP
jgi:hypothetical protein